MASEALESVQRWTGKRRTALVLQILKGETSAQEASREQELTVGEVEGWVEKGLAAIENQLRSRPHDEEALKDEEVGRLKQEIGELVLDNEILREAAKPYGREDVGREKGVLPHASERRICRVLEVPRSSLSPGPAPPLLAQEQRRVKYSTTGRSSRVAAFGGHAGTTDFARSSSRPPRWNRTA